MENRVVSPGTPSVDSFVLRFVHDAPNDGAPRSDLARGWHGVVVHVRSNAEKFFVQIADAVAFVARCVDIGDFVFKPE